MDAAHVYALLQQACRILDENDDHAIAAMVGQSLVMLAARYDLPHDDDDCD